MANEINLLMSLDPLELSAQQIDAIIDYHRKARASYAAGGKPKKGGSTESLDLSALGLISAPKVDVKRRKF